MTGRQDAQDLHAMSQEELEAAYRKALDLAARLLAYRALSARALRDKLIAKGCAEEAADYAIAYLQAHGFQDDQKYAESTVRSYTRRGYGTLRIRQELRRRGVEREEADRAMGIMRPTGTPCVRCSTSAWAAIYPTGRKCRRRLRPCSGAGSCGRISAAH